jgi:hypothetical protein
MCPNAHGRVNLSATGLPGRLSVGDELREDFIWRQEVEYFPRSVVEALGALKELIWSKGWRSIPFGMDLTVGVAT